MAAKPSTYSRGAHCARRRVRARAFRERADVRFSFDYVRFTPESGHRARGSDNKISGKKDDC